MWSVEGSRSTTWRNVRAFLRTGERIAQRSATFIGFRVRDFGLSPTDRFEVRRFLTIEFHSVIPIAIG